MSSSDRSGLRPLSDVPGDDIAWSLVDAAPDGIVVVDDAGTILVMNRQMEELFGYDRGELLGRSVDELLPSRFGQVHRAHRTRYRAAPHVRAMGIGQTLFGRRRDGAEFPVEVSLSPLATDAGQRVIAVVRDVTARLELENDAQRIRRILDSTSDASFIFDAETLHFTYVSQGGVEQVGYTLDELLTMTPLHLNPELDEAAFVAKLAPLASGELPSTTFATIHRRRDGTDVPVEVVLQASEPDENGSARSFVAIVRDISGRLEAESRLRKAEQELHVLEDRDRIARDLHDLVIQRLFAAGMSLQGVVGRVGDHEVAGRIEAVVDDLDGTIRELRSVIFGLQHATPAPATLGRDILDVVAAERPALGFEPVVSFSGALDHVPPHVASELLATLREALSNVARHAHAQSVGVSVDVGDDVVLRVVDDGVGVTNAAEPPRSSRGLGLENARHRAEVLGGAFSLRDGPVGGTLLEWRVPLA